MTNPSKKSLRKCGMITRSLTLSTLLILPYSGRLGKQCFEAKWYPIPLPKKSSVGNILKQVKLYVPPKLYCPTKTLQKIERFGGPSKTILTCGQRHRKDPSHQSLQELQYHKYGKKAGNLLARLCKGQQTLTHIASVKDNKGNIATSPKDINAILERCYAPPLWA